VDARDFHGIEDWGYRLLGAESKSWSDLEAGLSGAVEVAVVRNAFAHGTQVIDTAAEDRLAAAGVTTLSAGTIVSLDYDRLQTYRERLRRLLNLGGIRRATQT
jgi:hypothetical protein